MNIRNRASEYLRDTIAIRRKLHQHPEISGEEKWTSETVKKYLSMWEIPYREIPGNGILGLIDSGKGGRGIALRADMDALPIQEKTMVPYQSEIEGKAHLCGHDCHTASLLTAARILNECKSELTGKIHLIFQPSEEAPGCGAEQMIAHGAMENMNAVFGVHMYNNIGVGKVSVQPGPRMAASLRAVIEIIGVGGHGGSPHQCVDATVAASAVVMNLQTIASRELNMLDSAVITVGTFHSGTSQFAVSDYAKLELTIKFLNAGLKDKIKESITRIVENTVAAYRATCKIRIDGFLRPVVNDEYLSELASESMKKLYGSESLSSCPAWCASEDYGAYEVCAPGIFAFIGGRNEEKNCIYPAHHPCFNVDEDALEYASALYAQFAIDFLKGKNVT